VAVRIIGEVLSSSEFSVGDSHGRFVVEEGLIVLFEDFVYV
jgi:hypothetical protein